MSALLLSVINLTAALGVGILGGGIACTAICKAVQPELVPGLAARDVYLCGPPGLAGAVRRSLVEAGVPRSQLHEGFCW